MDALSGGIKAGETLYKAYSKIASAPDKTTLQSLVVMYEHKDVFHEAWVQEIRQEVTESLSDVKSILSQAKASTKDKRARKRVANMLNEVTETLSTLRKSKMSQSVGQNPISLTPEEIHAIAYYRIKMHGELSLLIRDWDLETDFPDHYDFEKQTPLRHLRRSNG